MLLFVILLAATFAHSAIASDQITEDCNSRFLTCTASDNQRRPVCGTDTVTYPSRCHLLRAQCQGLPVSIQNRGKCKGCGREDRSTFNKNLIKIFKTEYNRMAIAMGNETQSAYQESDRLVLDWKFSVLDKNKDNYLEKSEYRDLRRLVKKVVKPKRCAKTFTMLCDLDHDNRISREEWASYLGLDFNLMQESVTTLTGHLPSLDDDTTLERKEEPEGNDCHSDRKAALEEQKINNSEFYIPECTADGRYQTIQCYKSTGYCWCVHEDNGKPIPGTSVKDQVPKCDSIPAPSRPMNGCPDSRKQIFLRELMELMKKKMAMAANKTNSDSTLLPIKDSWQVSPEEQVATWNFLVLDKNKNRVLERKEWKNFRALVSSKPQLRRCGKRLPRHCDVNNDRKISITEWLNCVSAQHANTLTVDPTSVSRRRGLNPLQIYLKGED